MYRQHFCNKRWRPRRRQTSRGESAGNDRLALSPIVKVETDRLQELGSVLICWRSCTVTYLLQQRCFGARR